jgi:hypothetical protein
MAIGNPVTLTSNVASKVISSIATSGQTLFLVQGGYRINQISVFRNGVKLTESDYTARDGSSVTLLSPATLYDVLEFQVFDDFRVADALNVNSGGTVNGNVTVIGIVSATSFVGGFNLGIQSTGTNVTTGVITALNFIGAGNTFAYNAGTKTVDISIAGGGGGGVGEPTGDVDGLFNYVAAASTITASITFDATNAGAYDSYVVSVVPNITIASGIGVTVGTGKTMVIDILQLGGL